MWNHILRDQLDVDEAAFWECVQNGVKPARGKHEQPAEALPADLVYQLINRVGLSEDAVAKMSKDEAVARMQQFWIEG